jgi:hypothetical protein
LCGRGGSERRGRGFWRARRPRRTPQQPRSALPAEGLICQLEPRRRGRRSRARLRLADPQFERKGDLGRSLSLDLDLSKLKSDSAVARKVRRLTVGRPSVALEGGTRRRWLRAKSQNPHIQYPNSARTYAVWVDHSVELGRGHTAGRSCAARVGGAYDATEPYMRDHALISHTGRADASPFLFIISDHCERVNMPPPTHRPASRIPRIHSVPVGTAGGAQTHDLIAQEPKLDQSLLAIADLSHKGLA